MAHTYRSARLSEVSIIAGFQIDMAHETEGLELNSEVLLRGVRAVLDDPSLGRFYVAEEDGRVIACALITYEWSDWRNGTVWWLQSVYVAPDARRRGVYAGLYAHIKRFAEADERVRGIRLYVDRRNIRAQTVYSRLGMTGDHYQVFEWMKDSKP